GSVPGWIRTRFNFLYPAVSHSGGGPAVQLSDIDLTDMDRFQAAFPHEWFTFLRREQPVWLHPPNDTEGNERGFWVATKYEDVIAVSRDWQTYSSEKSPEAETGGIMI